jgi:hypothetical protein
MRLLWAEPARTVVAEAPPALEGLWSAIYAAENAALWLALADPAVGDPRCSEAAADLCEALGELEWVQPDVMAGAVIDLGPVTPLDDFGVCLAQTAGVLRGIVELAGEVVGVGGEHLGVSELVAVSRAVHLVANAYRRLTGDLL